MGDSITALNTTLTGTTQLYYGRGYFSWANVLLGHRLDIVANSGIGGQRSDEILARLQAGVLAYRPQYCVLLAGANDVAQGIATAVVTANLQSMYDQIRQAGIKLIVGTITPTTNATTGAMQTVLLDTNTWIRAYAAAHTDVVLADWYATMANTGPADPKSGYTVDGVHPSHIGAAAMGVVLNAALTSVVPASDTLIVTGSEPNLLTNGLMSVGSPLATGWSTSWSGTTGTAATSIVARGDGKPGTWQQVSVTVAGSQAHQLFQQNLNIGTDWNIGDTVFGECEFQTDASGWSITAFNCALEFFSGTGATTDVQHGGGDAASTYQPPSGVFRTPAMQIPVGTAKLQFFVRIFGTGTYRVSRCRVKRGTP